ncbi:MULTISPECIES: ABC transporter permease [Nonomuraea]|uniref:ABC transporter permease n=1 Tax=Nonomuraea ferruginea TaxID=46174 RepID=A0ABT4SX16_9ACTN|nr:ABC transporter permease [Nonomuraea ferruginea]MDA0641650.1 ABC transporter permease [Nonomuraea ferruginea]
MPSLVLAHTRYQVIEQIRVPIGLLASGLFPAIAMLAFAVPFVGDDPVASTLSMGSMMLVGAMSAALMGLSISVAMDREQPFNPYLRTLPAGPFPHFAGRILTTTALMVVSTFPVILVAGLFTEADLAPARLAAIVGAALAGSLPFMLIGLFLGLVLPSKAAIAVSQILFFPFAIVGGLMLPPQVMPEFLTAISPYVPSRGGGELVWWAGTGAAPDTLALVVLAGWTVVAGAAAAWAYRRDEGRRFT